jgi:Tol biopolymer transport system component
MTDHTRSRTLLVVGLATAVTVGLTAGSAGAAGPPRSKQLERVSVTSAERQTGGAAPRFLKMSGHGRSVVFDSPASDLVPGDTNREQDVFVRDRNAGTTKRVSVSSAERQGNAQSHEAAISSNGRFVAFTSGASNLVKGDTNDANDVFVRDLKAGTTRRVSVGAGGQQANGSSFLPSISRNGRFVAFQSTAANLTRRDRNDSEDVFVRDLKKKTTSRVSVPPRGRQFAGPSALPVISDNGRYVAFISNPRNPDIFDVYLRDRRAKTTRLITNGVDGQPLNGATGQIAISGNGRYVGYMSDATNLVRGDTNGQWDTFVYDARTRVTRRVSVGTGGVQSNGFSDQPSLSRTGRYVGFASEASNLVAGDTNDAGDAFVHDLRKGVTRRISVAGRQQANDTSGPSYAPQVALSADGHHAAFVSTATNLVAGDTNDAPDVYAWDASRR